MNPLAVGQALILLAAANGAPVVAKWILGPRLAWPVDGGARFADGRAWFGPAKTVRGVAASVAATVAIAPLVGVDWTLGLAAAAAAMAGDLGSSFVKRRLGLAPSSQALGLDHVPESLFPLLALSVPLGLSPIGILTGTVAFWIGALGVSRLLYRFGLRDRPH